MVGVQDLVCVVRYKCDFDFPKEGVMHHLKTEERVIVSIKINMNFFYILHVIHRFSQIFSIRPTPKQFLSTSTSI